MKLLYTLFSKNKRSIKIAKLCDLPYDDNDKIQHVPTVSHVRILVHHQTVSDNLQKGFNRENDEEGILNRFLQIPRNERRREIQICWINNKKNMDMA